MANNDILKQLLDRRENYINIKTYKDDSRLLSEEEELAKSPLRKSETTSCHSVVGRELDEVREVTSRLITGISVQHYKTQRGIKLAVTVQTAEQARLMKSMRLTAELKYFSRLREVKPKQNSQDTELFQQVITAKIQQIQESGNKNHSLGRLHQSGKRAAWIRDSYVEAFMTDRIVHSVIVMIEGDEYSVEMNEAMSHKQQQYYHTSGTYGTIRLPNQVAPTIWEIQAK